jgi:hypothetical protein
MKQVLALFFLLVGALPVFAQQDEPEICQAFLDMIEESTTRDATTIPYFLYLEASAIASYENPEDIEAQFFNPGAPTERTVVATSEDEVVFLFYGYVGYDADSSIRRAIRKVFRSGVNSFSYRPATEANARELAEDLGYDCPTE